MKLTFHGGAREVTGACYLLETKRARILIDCGLFQGSREFDDLNFDPFTFDPSSLDALFVTHAHLDHIGRIPKLVHDGFKGSIISTPPTRDLARLMLEDAVRLAGKEKRPLYSMDDVNHAFKLWRGMSYYAPFEVKEISVKLHNAGHILGSSFVECKAEGKHILFSGDLGNVPSILLPPPDMVQGIDYLAVESAYGSKVHESNEERVVQLERAVEDVASRHGTLMIPAFATERTQEVLHLLNEMVHFKRIPDMPFFVDAPLAIRVTDVFETYAEYYRNEIRDLLHEHPHLFKFKRLTFTETTEASKAINTVSSPKVIIAGSGMMQGGRILHHLKRYLPDPHSILLIVGYQGAGSLGRRLLDGEKVVKVLGEDILVQAEIRKINGFSAHADNPQLLTFVSVARDTLKHVFVVQGEEAEALHLTQEVRDHLGLVADAPMLHQEFEL